MFEFEGKNSQGQHWWPEMNRQQKNKREAKAGYLSKLRNKFSELVSSIYNKHGKEVLENINIWSLQMDWK